MFANRFPSQCLLKSDLLANPLSFCQTLSVRSALSPAAIVVKLPLWYLSFWFVEAPIALSENLFKLLLALEHFLSVTLMLKTFFRPWKNERRKGYVIHAIAIAATLRFCLIILDLFLLATVLIIGAFAILLLVALPVIGVFFLFLGPLGYEFIF